MSRSNSVGSQQQKNLNQGGGLNATTTNMNTSQLSNNSKTLPGGLSIHLGNYIITVEKDYIQEVSEEMSQSPTKQQQVHRRTNSRASNKAADRSKSPAIPLPTNEIQNNGLGAVQFELMWLKFLKQAEDEYNQRLCRNEKQQPLSIFEVNIDIFELYLLKVSGRALAKIQHHNLDLKSSMCADLKIFDDQSGNMPPEHVMQADQDAEISKRRERRLLHRLRKRRETANFGATGQFLTDSVVEGTIPYQEVKDHQHHIQQETPENIITVETNGDRQEFQVSVLDPHVAPEQHVSEERKEESLPLIQPEPVQMTQSEEQIQEVPARPETPPVAVPKKQKKVMIDSLNDRSDDEDEEGGQGGSSPGDRDSPIQEEDDEFARDDMGTSAENVRPQLETQEISPNLNVQIESSVHQDNNPPISINVGENSLVVSADGLQQSLNRTNGEELPLKNVTDDHNPSQNLEVSLEGMEDQSHQPSLKVTSQQHQERSVDYEQHYHSVASVLPDHSVVDALQQAPVLSNKIKIGDQSIGDPYMSSIEEGPAKQGDSREEAQNNGHQRTFEEFGEHYTLNEVSQFDNSNPFREKSVISHINSPTKSFPIQDLNVQSQNAQNHTNSDVNHEKAVVHQSSIQHQETDIVKQPGLDNSHNFAHYQSAEGLRHAPSDLGSHHHLHMHAEGTKSDTIIATGMDHQRSQNDLRHVQGLASGRTFTTDNHKQIGAHQFASQISVDSIEKTASYHDHSHINYEQNANKINVPEDQLASPKASQRLAAQPEMEPEKEVILRFEVAVGTTPLNLTFDDVSAVYEQHPLRNEIAVGTTPLDRTVDQMREQLPEIPQRADAAIGTTQRSYSKNDTQLVPIKGNDVALSPHNVTQSSLNTNHLPSATGAAAVRAHNSPQGAHKSQSNSKERSPTPNRLEVTLTAEPDKPILVEVRGGEKQFLISALTKHIYDIISHPDRLNIIQEPNGTVKFEEGGSDPNLLHLEPEVDPSGQGAFRLGNQNINLKLRSVSKSNGSFDNSLPQLRNHGGRNAMLFDTQTKEEMYQTSLQKVATGGQLRNSREILNSSQKINQSPKIDATHEPENPFRQSIIGSPDKLHELGQDHNSQGIRQSSGKKNPQQWQNSNGSARMISGRSAESGGMALTPLSNSQYEETRNESNLKKQNPQLLPVVNKRTTVHAHAQGLINEESQRDSFESQSIHMVQVDSNPQQSFNEKEENTSGQGIRITRPQRDITEESFRKQQSLEIEVYDQVQRQVEEQLRSRPETANFNRAYAAVALHNEEQLNSLQCDAENEQIQEKSTQRLQTPKQHMNIEQDISIADQSHSLGKSRLETPGADALEGDHYNHMENAEPAELEGYIASPLHPKIPDPHPNGYFPTDQDYMAVMQQETIGLGSSDSNDRYLTPKLAYYDNFPTPKQQQYHNIPTPDQIKQQLQRQQSVNDFYSNQYGSYSDAEQNTEPDFILAEGYPLLNFVQRDGGRNSLHSLKTDSTAQLSQQQQRLKNRRLPPKLKHDVPQLFDLTSNSFNPLQANNTSGTLSTPPYRIRKVILPNYPNAANISHQSEVDSQKASPSSTLKPVLNNTLQVPNQNQLRKQKTVQATQKQLPMVKTRKRLFNNTVNNTIYGINGGPAYKTIQLSQSHGGQTKSLSPLRNKKNQIYYTSNYMTQKQLLKQFQSMAAQTQASSGQGTLAPLNLEEFAQFAYYSQSPQPRVKNSPYLSDDEFKILHDYYDIQCEPTGLNRAGVPLMKVKRRARPKNRTFNIFNFPDDPNANVHLPKTLTSLQIFYPQFQPNSYSADLMSKTLSTTSKWFDRFNQSTRNLNNTIKTLHQQHSRKLRSYSISNLNSQLSGESIQKEGVGESMLKTRSGSQQSLFLRQGKNFRGTFSGAKAAADTTCENTRDTTILQQPELIMNNTTTTELGQGSRKKGKLEGGSGQRSSTTFMPPLHKIYTATMSHQDQSQDKSRSSNKKGGGKQLPPRPGQGKKGPAPKIAVNILGGGGGIDGLTLGESNGGSRSNLVIPAQTANIINTNHNQYVCFGVNIITKSDK